MNFGGYIRNLLLVLADLICIYGVWTDMVLGFHAAGRWYDPRFYLRMWPVGVVQRVALDVQYVLSWSPWLDIRIIIKTAFSVLLMRGVC